MEIAVNKASPDNLPCIVDPHRGIQLPWRIARQQSIKIDDRAVAI